MHNYHALTDHLHLHDKQQMDILLHYSYSIKMTRFHHWLWRRNFSKVTTNYELVSFQHSLWSFNIICMFLGSEIVNFKTFNLSNNISINSLTTIMFSTDEMLIFLFSHHRILMGLSSLLDTSFSLNYSHSSR